MDYPIPYHLKKIFNVTSCEGNDLQGKIVCECGCDRFTVMQNEKGDDYSVGLMINGICARCGEYHVIFDESEHGWNGFVNRSIDRRASGRNQLRRNVSKIESTVPNEAAAETLPTIIDRENDVNLTRLCCEGCGSEILSIELDLEVEDREQFIEETVSVFPDRVSPDDYVNAFNWIVVNVTCSECGETFEWVNMELS